MTPLIKRAAQLSSQFYGNQRRRLTGENDFIHIRNLARLLSVTGAPEHLVAAGFLYNVLEDDHLTPDDIINELNLATHDVLIGLVLPTTSQSIETRLVVLAQIANQLSVFGALADRKLGPKTYSESYLQITRLEIDLLTQSLLTDGIMQTPYQEHANGLFVVVEHIYNTAKGLYDYHTYLKQSRIDNRCHLP